MPRANCPRYSETLNEANEAKGKQSYAGYTQLDCDPEGRVRIDR